MFKIPFWVRHPILASKLKKVIEEELEPNKVKIAYIDKHRAEGRIPNVYIPLEQAIDKISKEMDVVNIRLAKLDFTIDEEEYYLYLLEKRRNKLVRQASEF